MPDKLTLLVTVVLAISVASERLVEIIKNATFLEKEWSPETEGYRKALLQVLAVASGCATAWLASDYIPQDLVGVTVSKFWSILGLGLLASGGSGMWNAVLTYVGKLKDVKGNEKDIKAAQAEVAKQVSTDVKSNTLTAAAGSEKLALMAGAAN